MYVRSKPSSKGRSHSCASADDMDDKQQAAERKRDTDELKVRTVPVNKFGQIETAMETVT